MLFVRRWRDKFKIKYHAIVTIFRVEKFMRDNYFLIEIVIVKFYFALKNLFIYYF
jgi:hypothetical protein